MSSSAIEWTEFTWNPVTGCTKISAGCRFCYAETMSLRLRSMGQSNYRNGFELTLQPNMLDRPLRLRKPRLIFVNSMSDLFHQRVPYSYVLKVFEVMQEAGQHQFQVLTKRAARLSSMAKDLPWPPNVWMGVSVESEQQLQRVEALANTPAQVKFLSLEPLLGPLPGLGLDGIDWVIVGGESGRTPRPMEPGWVRQIRDRCLGNEVPFFFKQWGGRNKKKAGRVLDGRVWDQMPEILRPDAVASSKGGAAIAV